MIIELTAKVLTLCKKYNINCQLLQLALMNNYY